MTANAADFAGSGCGRRYEKELETHFRDCLLFYLDGRIRFERYCYGEAACLVFSVWAHGFDADGNILWDREPEFESQKTAIPRVLTDIQEDGNALQFDGAFKRYVKTEEFDEDKPNGYGKFKVLLKSFNRFLIISLDVLICRYSPLFRAFPALFISEEPHKSFYYPLCFRSQK